MSELIAKFRAGMQDSFRDPTMTMMGDFGHMTLQRARRVDWLVEDKKEAREVDVSTIGSL